MLVIAASLPAGTIPETTPTNPASNNLWFCMRCAVDPVTTYGYCDSDYLDDCREHFKKQKRRRRSLNRKQSRLAPLSNADEETYTQLNFNNTRHRYPWICSLRTKGVTAEHICAVTLLSLPPAPTIIIGPAHCTYLCKDGGPSGARLESCCCTPQPNGCSEDTIRCGENPGAVEMDPAEMLILCGEWETGPTPIRFSGEKYNVDLQIKEIVRHPDFRPQEGVDGGSDIAVFKISGEANFDSLTKTMQTTSRIPSPE